MKLRKHRISQGFTLVEMAIVVVIFGLLLTAVLTPLQAQRNIAAQRETETILENAQQALVGFAQAHGRLPCPATSNGGAFPDGTGTANPNASGGCVQMVGFLPGATLGLQSTDAQGYAIDAWNNRIRYAVTQTSGGGAPSADFTTAGDMHAVGMANLNPNLRVCATATPINCSASIHLINNAVAVILSLGETGAQGSGGADENANLDFDNIFVSRDIGGAGNASGSFDHLVTWISPYTLYNAMMQAGQMR